MELLFEECLKVFSRAPMEKLSNSWGFPIPPPAPCPLSFLCHPLAVILFDPAAPTPSLSHLCSHTSIRIFFCNYVKRHNILIFL